jgi:hypothetical protein
LYLEIVVQQVSAWEHVYGEGKGGKSSAEGGGGTLAMVLVPTTRNMFGILEKPIAPCPARYASNKISTL